mmetsp:Transcript_72252/g.182593  ORF Transcript_72252/g.182593 Transcript_72252/m.182593 type:complete len:257 (+) Transcript_72252:1675-2445(+)
MKHEGLQDVLFTDHLAHGGLLVAQRPPQPRRLRKPRDVQVGAAGGAAGAAAAAGGGGRGLMLQALHGGRQVAPAGAGALHPGRVRGPLRFLGVAVSRAEDVHRPCNGTHIHHTRSLEFNISRHEVAPHLLAIHVPIGFLRVVVGWLLWAWLDVPVAWGPLAARKAVAAEGAFAQPALVLGRELVRQDLQLRLQEPAEVSHCARRPFIAHPHAGAARPPPGAGPGPLRYRQHSLPARGGHSCGLPLGHDPPLCPHAL